MKIREQRSLIRIEWNPQNAVCVAQQSQGSAHLVFDRDLHRLAPWALILVFNFEMVIFELKYNVIDGDVLLRYMYIIHGKCIYPPTTIGYLDIPVAFQFQLAINLSLFCDFCA